MVWKGVAVSCHQQERSTRTFVRESAKVPSGTLSKCFLLHQGGLMALEIRALCLFAWLSETVFESEDLFVFTLLSASVRALCILMLQPGCRLGDVKMPFCVNISRDREPKFHLKCQNANNGSWTVYASIVEVKGGRPIKDPEKWKLVLRI